MILSFAKSVAARNLNDLHASSFSAERIGLLPCLRAFDTWLTGCFGAEKTSFWRIWRCDSNCGPCMPNGRALGSASSIGCSGNAATTLDGRSSRCRHRQ